MASTTTNAQARQLRHARVFLLVIVLFGVVVSVGANTLDTPDFVDKMVVGWPPVALLLSIEALVRIPASRRAGAAGRVLATVAVGIAAGWLSYWHMASTVSQHGESGGGQYIWPFSVDGLMVIAAIGLVEVGARLRALDQTARVDASAAPLIAAVEEAIVAPSWLPPKAEHRAMRSTSALSALNRTD